MKCSLLIIAALTLTAVAGCTPADNARRSTDGTPLPSITVSIPPQASLLRAIAGDSINIVTLLGSEANPETFEPGIKTMTAVAASDMIMLSGALGFEQVLVDKLTDNNRDIKVVDTSAGIELIYGTHYHNGHEHRDAPDPHTWTSARNARIIASNMLKALVELDPAHTNYYTSRAALLDSRLDSIDCATASRLEHGSEKAFIVWHPSLSYYARDYGLRQIVIASADSRETSIASTRASIDSIRANGNTHTLFLQAGFDADRAHALSDQTGASIVTINPLDYDWEKQFNIITDALTRH